MAKQKIDMEELFRTLPEEPEEFKDYCYSLMPKIAIYYRRLGKVAECLCGKCGKLYITDEIPVRHENAVCPCCGNEGHWEWRRITYRRYDSHDVTLIQCTNNGTLAVRAYRISQTYQQGYKADIKLRELKRIFLQLGDAYHYNNEYHYGSKGYKRQWNEGKGGESVSMSNLYIGWKDELKRSCLKYCDIDGLIYSPYGKNGIVEIMTAFANNPAIEMYHKAGMDYLVGFLLYKEGKTSLVNQRKNTLKGQLRLNDKAKINRLILERGDTTLLKIMQKEKRTGQNYTEVQEDFLRKMYRNYGTEKQIDFLLKYMTIQQLMNRITKYKAQGGYSTECTVISAYFDYLTMRHELGYDMTNEVYLYPKNLKKKHDQMAKEQILRKDELHIKKMCQKYPDIASKFKKLDKKYSFESGLYFIRPAKDAGEIVMEGRLQHHCVGGENYLSKHNKGETSILLLRRKETPDTPYYTIEIRGTEIIQWYGAYDKKPDEEIVKPWLDAYVEHLKKPRMRAAG